MEEKQERKEGRKEGRKESGRKPMPVISNDVS